MAESEVHVSQSCCSSPVTDMTFKALRFTESENEISLANRLLPEISREDFLVSFKYVIELCLGSIIAYLGVVGNIVTIIVLIKIGFRETTSISLTFIAFWDAIKILSQVVIRIMCDWDEATSRVFDESRRNTIGLITIRYVEEIAGGLSGAVTGYVAVERCLCLKSPFTIKILLSRKVVTAINVLISVLVFGSYATMYTLMCFHWADGYKNYNPTIVQSVLTEEISYRHNLEFLRSTDLLGFAYASLSFVVMCVCTPFMLYHLKTMSTIESSTVNNKCAFKTPIKRSFRDRQVTKMILVAIIIHLPICVPMIFHYCAREILSDHPAYGRYKNLLLISANCSFFSDLIKSSVNPIILLFLCGKFKQTLTSMCRREKRSR